MISTTGSIPWIAEPMPAPTMAISEIGVFRTRVGAELVQHPLRDAHRPAHLGDVLAHDEDAVVTAHRGRKRVAHRLAIRQLSHAGAPGFPPRRPT